jgi:hypothetical protein
VIGRKKSLAVRLGARFVYFHLDHCRQGNRAAAACARVVHVYVKAGIGNRRFNPNGLCGRNTVLRQCSHYPLRRQRKSARISQIFQRSPRPCGRSDA